MNGLHRRLQELEGQAREFARRAAAACSGEIPMQELTDAELDTVIEAWNQQYAPYEDEVRAIFEGFSDADLDTLAGPNWTVEALSEGGRRLVEKLGAFERAREERSRERTAR